MLGEMYGQSTARRPRRTGPASVHTPTNAPMTAKQLFRVRPPNIRQSLHWDNRRIPQNSQCSLLLLLYGFQPLYSGSSRASLPSTISSRRHTKVHRVETNHNFRQTGGQPVSDRMRELLAGAAQDHVYEQRSQGQFLDEIRQW